MFRDEGYSTLCRIRGMPLRVHWTFPMGMLVVGGPRFAPGVWLGYFVLIAVHELGHGALARHFGHVVTGLDVHGFGGLCSYSGYPTALQVAAIAWGGVLGQALLGALTLGLVAGLGHPDSALGGELVYVFTVINAGVALFNLLPFAGLDGARAWKLPGLWWRHARRGDAATAQRGSLAAGFAEKLRQREPGPFRKDADPDNARVVRIERGSDGRARGVDVDESEESERLHGASLEGGADDLGDRDGRS